MTLRLRMMLGFTNAAIGDISRSAEFAAAGTRAVSGHVFQVSGDAATSRGAADDVARTVRDLMDRNQALGQAIMEFVSEMRQIEGGGGDQAERCDGNLPCADVHKIAGAHLANVRKKLSDLVKLEAILAETVARCSDGATPDCPVLDILDAGRSGIPGARSR